jgi:cytochrome c oxidase subunit 2
MGFYVFAETPARFHAWLAHESRPATHTSPVVFRADCSGCHAIRGTSATSRVGPDLTHIGSRTSLAALAIPNTPERLAQWLRDPQSIKPGSQMPALGLTSAQIAQLVAYLEKLK